MPLPHVAYHVKLDHCRSNGMSVPMDIRRKKTGPLASRFQGHSRSLELTWIDLIPMTSYWHPVVTIGLFYTVSNT